MFQRSLQKVIVGSAVAFATATLLPIAKETLKPVIGQISRQMKYYIVSAKEGIEDIVAEVKFERMKKHLNQESQMVIDYEEILQEQEKEAAQSYQ